MNTLEKAKQKYLENKRNYEHYNKMINESIYEETRKYYEFKCGQSYDIMETLIYIFGNQLKEIK